MKGAGTSTGLLLGTVFRVILRRRNPSEFNDQLIFAKV